MKTKLLATAALTLALSATAVSAVPAFASGGSGGSGGGGGGTTTTSGGGTTPKVDSIKIDKVFTNATSTSGGEMLLKASSSDASARLFAYRPDGTLIGEVQNGGGSRYGGTVMAWQPYDPGTVTFRSSSGGRASAPTTPFVI
jgi:hypothetical protein